MKEHVRGWRNNHILLNNGLGPRDLGAISDALSMYSQLNEQQQKLWTALASRMGAEFPYKLLGGKKEFVHTQIDPRVEAEKNAIPVTFEFSQVRVPSKSSI